MTTRLEAVNDRLLRTSAATQSRLPPIRPPDENRNWP